MQTKKRNATSVFIIIGIVIADCFIWQHILSLRVADTVHEYFLAVGQGDSELIVFPGNRNVLVDAGPDASVLSALGKILPAGDDYIDLAIISYPELADFNGFNFLLDHYRVGTFAYNGRDDSANGKEWAALKNKIKERGIPLVTLGRGDIIHVGSRRSDEIAVLSPNPDFAQSPDLIESGLVLTVRAPEFKTLLTADIPITVENWLVANEANLRANVLKIAGHGSKYSSDEDFLRAANPEIAVIAFGAKSAFARPSKEALARLAEGTNARVLQTDQAGTVEVFLRNGKLVAVKQQ